LKKEFSILVYEKDKILNSILHYQISNYYKNTNKVLISENLNELFEIVSKKKFDVYILNLIDFNDGLKKLIEIFQNQNKHTNIIGYHNTETENVMEYKSKLLFLRKPFKLEMLLDHLDRIITKCKIDNSNKFLMNHVIFSPTKKIISNLETKKTEHLTEKENNLLIYFYNKKNTDILKKDLLTNIWGVSDEINTHTLETHIYRLKQKLNKLEPNLSFSLINKNGLYCLKYNK